MAANNLTEVDKRIIDYIRSNPGCSKEEVVRAMNGDPSRLTVLKHLDLLKGQITTKKINLTVRFTIFI